MALINCSECGTQLSEFAKECPKCGNLNKNSNSHYHIKTQAKPNLSEKSVSGKKSNNIILGVLLIIIILIGVTLPFHYIPSRSLVFPKEYLTFNKTFITETDIENIINQYNNSSFIEKISMLNDPFLKKLKENSIIVDLSRTNTELNEQKNEADQNSDDEYEKMMKIDTVKAISLLSKYYELSLSKDLNNLYDCYANPTEVFFGKLNVTPEEIIKDHAAYYKKFTFQKCTVDYSTMKINKNMSGDYFVEYKIELLVKKESSGKLLRIFDSMNVKFNEYNKISSITEKLISKETLN